MMQAFSSSFFGQIVKVWYILKVFVKHDAWNEWGEGNAIEFPIKILPKPTQIFANEVGPKMQEVQELDSVELSVDHGDEELADDRELYKGKA